LPKRQFSSVNRSIRVGSGANAGRNVERAKLAKLLQEAERYSQAGDLARADKRYRAALKRAPNDPQINFLLGRHEAKSSEKAPEAIKHLQKSIELRPDYSEGHGQLGKLYFSIKDYPNAELCFRKIIELNKGDWSGYLNLANTLYQQGQSDEASRVALDGLAITPRNPELLNSHGLILRQLDDMDAAEQSFRRAIKAQSDYLPAYYNLIALIELHSEIGDLPEILAAARKAGGATPAIVIAEARLLKRKSQFSEARQLLESLSETTLDDRTKARKSYLHGEICDRLDEPDHAFASFVTANRLRADTNVRHDSLRTQYLERIDRYSDLIDSAWNAPWSNPAPLDERSSPLFLVGFPRSGTTLIEMMLRGHPDICVAEEPPTLDQVRDRLDKMGEDRLTRLPALDGSEIAQLRRAYFTAIEAVLSQSEIDRARLVVDKQPLNIVNAALIYRMFPDARFIFIERHPCDCVLSCFMQSFVISEEMASFLSIKDAATLYDFSMSLWFKMRDRFEPSVITVKYEDLVADVEVELQKVADFIGVEWDAGLLAHQDSARRLELIRTPSRSQVIEPLYNRATSRWLKYQTQMADVLPILLPWADRFGYEDHNIESSASAQ